MKSEIPRRTGRARTRGRLAKIAAAVVAAAVLPLVAALPAAAGTVGTVVQTGSVPTLVTGSATPAELHFDATLPTGTTGAVRARLDMNSAQFPFGGYDPWRVINGLKTAQCSANGSAFTPCDWYTSGPGTPDATEIFLDLPTVQATPTVHYDVNVLAGPDFLPDDQDLTTLVQLTAADGGATLATGAVKMHLDVVPSEAERPAVYAVDKAGVLWRYRGTTEPKAPFDPRVRIGGGWQIYDLITKVSATSAAGRGDLVARDRSGVLWYYKGTGDPAQPFARRVRVGGGWGQYTAITAGGWHARGNAVLVARDASGRLWSYAETRDITHPFARRVLAGHGWNIYQPLTGFGNGVMGRDSSGVLWMYDAYAGTDTQPYSPRQRIGPGWRIYNLITSPGDTNADYIDSDVLARDGAGRLWLYTGTSTTRNLSPRTLVGGGWQIYTTII
jgi:hypothetical protein